MTVELLYLALANIFSTVSKYVMSSISRILVLGQDCIVFVDDFSVAKVPSSNGKKYYISSPTSQGRTASIWNVVGSRHPKKYCA